MSELIVETQAKSTEQHGYEFDCDCRRTMISRLEERLGQASRPEFTDVALMVTPNHRSMYIGWLGLRVSYTAKDSKGNLLKKRKDTWLRFSYCPLCGNPSAKTPASEIQESA